MSNIARARAQVFLKLAAIFFIAVLIHECFHK